MYNIIENKKIKDTINNLSITSVCFAAFAVGTMATCVLVKNFTPMVADADRMIADEMQNALGIASGVLSGITTCSGITAVTLYKTKSKISDFNKKKICK